MIFKEAQFNLTPSAYLPRAKKVDTSWSFKDYLGAFLSRVSSYRNHYIIEPGLYKVGNPDEKSEILVSANYQLSFNHLKKHLKNLNVWILVLDTKGINVWCAAGKGTFGTKELLRQMEANQVSRLVSHKRIILPQLGAVGVSAQEIKKKTGFRVTYGPVYASDIPEFFKNNFRVSPEMRVIHFNIFDRFVLTPMEIIPGAKYFLWYSLFIFIFMGLKKEGIIFSNGLFDGTIFYLAGAISVASGAFFTPLFLPFLPFRSFSLKGVFSGAAISSFLLSLNYFQGQEIIVKIFFVLMITTFSSFFALQFTGSTTFTNHSGVEKEHKYALKLYFASSILLIILIAVHKAVIEKWI